MKRVLICSPSNAIRGGVEDVVADLCRGLPQRGWEPLLGLAKGSRFNNVQAYCDVYPDLPIVEVDGTSGTRRGRVESLIRVIEATRPDIVISARIFDAFEAVRELKAAGKPVRLLPLVSVYEAPYVFDVKLYRDHIDLCAVVSKLLAAAVREWCGMPESRIAILPAGIQPALTHTRHPGSRLRIGYVGRLEQEQKRIFDLIPFLQTLDSTGIGYSLDVAGTGPSTEKLKAQLDPWIRGGSVVLHGWQDRKALYEKIYPSMDVLIHFAQVEGVPIAPREAMLHGVVPVVSRFMGLAAEGQLLHERNCLIFPIGDTRAAVDCILRLTREPGLMERLSASAMVSQEGLYSMEGSLDAWANALDRCLDLSVSRGANPVAHWPADGRLARLGLPPAMAQAIRRVLGRKHIHDDPGGEWPTSGGPMSAMQAREILEFASRFEQPSNCCIAESAENTAATS